MAQLIIWTERLSIGVAEIDEEHRVLIGHINSLYEVIGARGGRRGRKTLEPILEGLVRYTVEHFATEEHLMKHYAYPAAAAHGAIHRDLTGQVAKYREDLLRSRGAFSDELLHFLKKWLTTHILEEDKKLGAFLNAKGVR